MADQPTPDAPPPQKVSEEQERARALAAVLRDQAVREELAQEVESRRARRVRVRRGVLGAVWIAIVAAWIGGPPGGAVEAPPLPTLAEEARALRLSVFLQMQQIEAFRQTRSRLPDVLQEVGPPLPGMTYNWRDSRSYTLEGASPRVRIYYDSDRPPLEFVGESAARLVMDTGAGTS